MLDPYYLLGIAQTATADEIRAAYRHRAAEIHPDLQPRDKRPMAEEQMKQLNAARDLLLDPRRRAAYDDKIRLEMQKAMWRARRDSAIYETFASEAPLRPRRRVVSFSGAWFIAWVVIVLWLIMAVFAVFALSGTDADLLNSLGTFAVLGRCISTGFVLIFGSMMFVYILIAVARYLSN